MMEETSRERMEQRMQELEQQLQRLQAAASPAGTSHSVMDNADSTETPARTEGGKQVIYIQQSEKVPKFSGHVEPCEETPEDVPAAVQHLRASTPSSAPPAPDLVTKEGSKVSSSH
ncbi:uncharacterized protein LOC114450669 isoform X2 [Parambassis ranga]|uniref:Uncharacterized protein LOC114450669 isoform X2 n=1 Tax=Parambassis ranga TaxID=210632 RepID=A0A6P7K635_9TELE|nr:uncharacterized protein LOC114450669 isoform X2 [Parambassis ranga]